MDQLFALNRHLSAQEGQLLRLAEKSGIKRPQFLAAWAGNEVVTKWPPEEAPTKAWRSSPPVMVKKPPKSAKQLLR